VQFVDEVRITVQAGHGGNGIIAFRREKNNPLGGPSGGDGGDGGDIELEATERLSTLLDLHYRRDIKAQNGEHGRGKDQYGKGGRGVVVRVPVGTQVYDDETDELIADLDRDDMHFIVARGGRGGFGNMHFATPSERIPRRAEPGERGEHRRLRLELKLLADVGVVGFPNVGKSTFIAAVSAARPKIADYPFTTLVPNLGVASLGPDRSFVVADIPGIIEGAAEGAGLGLRFLRHVERCRVLLHVVAPDPDPSRDVLADYDVLEKELEHFDPELVKRPRVVALGKIDLLSREEIADLVARFRERGIKILPMSAATHAGTHDVLVALERYVRHTVTEEGEWEDDDVEARDEDEVGDDDEE
jgi:GTPase